MVLVERTAADSDQIGESWVDKIPGKFMDAVIGEDPHWMQAVLPSLV